MCGVEARNFALDFQNTIIVKLDPRIFPSFAMVLDSIICVLGATTTMATSAAMATTISLTCGSSTTTASIPRRLSGLHELLPVLIYGSLIFGLWAITHTITFISTVPKLVFDNNCVQSRSTVLDSDPQVGNAENIIHISPLCQNSFKHLQGGQVNRNSWKDKLQGIKLSIAQKMTKNAFELSVATDAQPRQNINDMVMCKQSIG